MEKGEEPKPPLQPCGTTIPRLGCWFSCVYITKWCTQSENDFLSNNQIPVVQALWSFLNLIVYLFTCVCLCLIFDQTKNDSVQKFGTVHPLLPRAVYKLFFVIFPLGATRLKNCYVTGMSAYLLDCLV